jgi:hypothetical protein
MVNGRLKLIVSVLGNSSAGKFDGKFAEIQAVVL